MGSAGSVAAVATKRSRAVRPAKGSSTLDRLLGRRLLEAIRC
jgi:hypothetical protein